MYHTKATDIMPVTFTTCFVSKYKYRIKTKSAFEKSLDKNGNIDYTFAK